jgi:hypothetical protein
MGNGGKMKHGLGRNPSPPDARDWTVDRLEAMIDAGTAVPVLWTDPVVLDQGQTPHCVGYAGAGFEATEEANAPADDTITNATGESLYYACKVIDGEPGAEDGTYVRSVAKALKKKGIISAYAFGTMAQGKAWVSKYGPSVVGVRWDYSMEEPDFQGYIHPDGSDAGGHGILWHAVYEPDNMLRNSWGDWGPLHGDCLITDIDLVDILSNGGEVMMAVRNTVVPTPTPVPDVSILKKILAELKELIQDIEDWLK